MTRTSVRNVYALFALMLPVGARNISFRVRTPDGDRVIRFNGTIDGDQIVFTRTVDVRPGGQPGGSGIFGAAGARTFTAQRSP